MKWSWYILPTKRGYILPTHSPEPDTGIEVLLMDGQSWQVKPSIWWQHFQVHLFRDPAGCFLNSSESPTNSTGEQTAFTLQKKNITEGGLFFLVTVKTKPPLVGGFNPFEKYDRQIGSFPQSSGWKFQKCLSCHHLDQHVNKKHQQIHRNSTLAGGERHVPGFFQVVISNAVCNKKYTRQNQFRIENQQKTLKTPKTRPIFVSSDPPNSKC